MSGASSEAIGTVDFPLDGWSEARLDELASAKTLPVAALVSCLAHFDVAAPKLRAVMERAADGELLSDAEGELVFWAIHILSAGRDPLSCKPLLRVLHRPRDELDLLLGDAVTMTLSRVFAGVFGGDDDALFACLADMSVDDYIRWGLFSALAFLTRDGKIAREKTEGFLARFDDEQLADADDASWAGWVEAIILLRLRAFAERVERNHSKTTIVEVFGQSADGFYEDLAEAEAMAPEDLTLFTKANAGYIDDICDALAWVSFNEVRPKSEPVPARGSQAPAMPITNPWRNVGRNDPCPCGSGKKAKKCCLVA